MLVKSSTGMDSGPVLSVDPQWLANDYLVTSSLLSGATHHIANGPLADEGARGLLTVVIGFVAQHQRSRRRRQETTHEFV